MSSNRTRNKTRQNKDKKKDKDSKKNKKNENENGSAIELKKEDSEKRNIDNVSAKAELENVNDNKKPSQSKHSEPEINSHKVDNLPSNSGGHSVTNNILNQNVKIEEINEEKDDSIKQINNFEKNEEILSKPQNDDKKKENPKLEKRKKMVKNNFL